MGGFVTAGVATGAALAGVSQAFALSESAAADSSLVAASGSSAGSTAASGSAAGSATASEMGSAAVGTLLIGAADITQTLEYDIVVVGGSNTGRAVTASATEEGAKAACLEKLDSSMGAGTYYGFVNMSKKASLIRSTSRSSQAHPSKRLSEWRFPPSCRRS